MADLPQDVASKVPSAFVPEAALVVSRVFATDPESFDGVPATPNRYRVESLASVHGTYPDVIAQAVSDDPWAFNRFWPTAEMLGDHQHGADPRESRQVVGVVQFASAAAAEAAIGRLNDLHGDPWRFPNEPFQKDAYTSYGGQSDLDRDLGILGARGGVVIADVGMSDAMSRPDSLRPAFGVGAAVLSLEVMAPPAKLSDGRGVFVGLDGAGSPVTVRTSAPLESFSEGEIVHVRPSGAVSMDTFGASLDASSVHRAPAARLVAEGDLREPLDRLRGDSSITIRIDAAAAMAPPTSAARAASPYSDAAETASRMSPADALARYADAIVLTEVEPRSSVRDQGDGRGPVALIDLVETGRFVGGESAIALVRDVMAVRPGTVVDVPVDLARAAQIEEGLRLDAGKSIALGSDAYLAMRRDFDSALARTMSDIGSGAVLPSARDLKVDLLDGGGHGTVGRHQVSQFIAKADGREVALYAVDGKDWSALRGLSSLDGSASLSVIPLGSDHPGRAAFLVRKVEERQVVIAASRADVISAVSAKPTAQVPSPAVSLTLRNLTKAVSQPEFAADQSGGVVRTGRVLKGEEGLKSVLSTFGSAAARKVYLDAATVGVELSRLPKDARRLFSMALEVSNARTRAPQAAATVRREREGASL